MVHPVWHNGTFFMLQPNFVKINLNACDLSASS